MWGRETPVTPVYKRNRRERPMMFDREPKFTALWCLGTQAPWPWLLTLERRRLEVSGCASLLVPGASFHTERSQWKQQREARGPVGTVLLEASEAGECFGSLPHRTMISVSNAHGRGQMVWLCFTWNKESERWASALVKDHIKSQNPHIYQAVGASSPQYPVST